MSSEIEVPETPNWLNDLEAKREQKLKARLGHEAGAGAPCLKCEDKCPGLDLHFWRKACKICRCPKEEHDVHDDDIYGWAQFQLLGSKPNKIKTKIVLPGKKDEVELEWAPKGQKETIDKYLKTLPPETLPVKGSQAAQERKQLLQKQLPIHDIDPALCHELNEEEVKRMEEYIAHIKNSSVGVGQIVNLSNVIKANLHNISPHEAHIIASKYATSIPFNEIVNLQSPNIAKNLQSLTLGKKPNLPVMHPSKLPSNPSEYNAQNSTQAYKFKDVTPQGYVTSSPVKGALPAQYSGDIRKPEEYSIDDKLLQGTRFDPSKTPSQFLSKQSNSYPSGGVKNQYGYENPLFSHNQPPKSVKDLMYSTYDPSTGPIPQDVDNQLGGVVKDSDYKPADNYNTFKHNPGAVGLSKFRLNSLQPEQLTVPEDHLQPINNPLGGIRNSDSKLYSPDDHLKPNVGQFKLRKPLQSFQPEQLAMPEDDFQDVNRQLGGVRNSDSKLYNPDDHLQQNPGLSKYRKPLESLQPEHLAKPEDDFQDINQQLGGVRNSDSKPYNPDDHLKQNPGLSNYRKALQSFQPGLAKPEDDFQDINQQLGGVRNSDSKLYNPDDGFKQNPGLSNYRRPLQSLQPEQLAMPEDDFQDVNRQLGGVRNSDSRLYNPDEKQNPGLSKYRKPLQSYQPEQLTVPEDYLEPQFVNVGSIQDINPDIRMATTQPNPGYTSGQQDEYSPDSIREIINNIKLPDCHYCKKPFEENEFAVTIDRASVLFHAKCFRCAGCNQCLADNIYFYHKETDNVYCGRDYAKIKGYPRCSACDELIFTKEYCLAENSTYHLKHFCCFLCDTPLAGQDYTSEDNKPYCLPCFESSKAAKCSTCEKIIKPDEPGCQLKGVHFHADDGCFRCIVCGVPLMGKKLLLRNEKLFCSHQCFNGRSQ